MFLRMKHIEWRLLNINDEVFVDLYNVTDNVMKERHKQGLGIIKHSTPISLELEDEIWKLEFSGNTILNNCVKLSSI